MFNKELLLATAGAQATQSTTGTFTLTPEYQWYDPDGVGAEQFYGYGEVGEDSYIRGNLGTVVPYPVYLFGQPMCSFGFADNAVTGWTGMRAWFKDSTAVSWPSRIKVICHSSGAHVFLDQVYQGLYGDPTNIVDYPIGSLDNLIAVGVSSDWEVQAVDKVLFTGVLSHADSVSSSDTIVVIHDGTVIYAIPESTFLATVRLAVGDIVAPRNKLLGTYFAPGMSSGISGEEVQLDGYSNPVFKITELRDGFVAKFDIMR